MTTPLELTTEQLVRNINKSRNASSNYHRIVKHKAYESVIAFNEYVKRLQLAKRVYRELGKVAGTTQVYSVKTHRYVHFTIYTKIPKFRTYRQQLAITNRQLYVKLADQLKLRDSIRILNKELSTPDDRFISTFDKDDDISQWTLEEHLDI